MANIRVEGVARRVGLVASVGLLTISNLSWAAEGPGQDSGAKPEDSGALSEVVVTAQFRSENAQNTPIAITALDAAALAASGLSNIGEAANHAPSVFIAPAASGFGQSASITIRGVGQSDPHIALEPGVGMYIDDVYYGMLSGSVFELLDADRVEVLRGPQGTLAGKNSIGGAVKLFSKAPGPNSDAFVEVGYGDYDHVIARGASNITLVPDKLFARVSAGTIQQSGYLKELDYTCATGQQLAFGNALGGSKRQTTSCKIGEEGGKDVVTARGSLR